MRRDETSYVHDTEVFLQQHLAKAESCLPRKRQHKALLDSAVHRPWRVFILGSLMLDLHVLLRTRLEHVAKAIQNGDEKVRDEWTSRARVGGFTAWAARAAKKLGARIWLSCVIPVPIPQIFQKFFEEIDADTSFSTIYPAPVPASIELSAPDGHLLLPRVGPLGAVSPCVPSTIHQDFDCVVMNPGAPVVRRTVLRKLVEAKCPNHRVPVVAICGRADWTSVDLSLVRDRGYFLFFNSREALTTANRISGNGHLSIEEAAEIIKESIGSSSLVVTLGRGGAMMLNGLPEPHFSRSLTVEKDSTGSGDMLAAFVGMRRTEGATEEESLDRGVTDVSVELLNR